MGDDMTDPFVVVWQNGPVVSRVQFKIEAAAISLASVLPVSAQVLETDTFKIVFANIHSPMYRGN